jgi:hypothetical protein
VQWWWVPALDLSSALVLQRVLVSDFSYDDVVQQSETDSLQQQQQQQQHRHP